MKAGYLILVAILAAFVLTGCDNHEARKRLSPKELPPGKNWSIDDAYDPKDKSPERSQKK